MKPGEVVRVPPSTDLTIGAIYHTTTACGVPHGITFCQFRLIAVLNPADSYHFEGTAWLDIEQIHRKAGAPKRFTRRHIYVIAAGLHLDWTPLQRIPAQAGKPRNTRPVPVIPRQRANPIPTIIPGGIR